MCKFLWNGHDEGKIRAKVKWVDVCLPKKEGDLGLKSLDDFNKALMISHLWNLVDNKNTLWVRWIHTYKLKGRSIWEVSCPHDARWTWRKILSLLLLVRSFIRYIVGNGQDTSLWYDFWHPNGVIVNSISPKNIARLGFSIKSKVAEVRCNGQWNWPSSQFLQPFETSLLSLGNKELIDRVVWHTSEGRIVPFSTKQTWDHIRVRHGRVTWDHIVWFSQCIPRHSIILWLAIKHKLITQDRMVWTHNDSLVCPLCESVMDSHNHLFFECVFSFYIWSSFDVLMEMQVHQGAWDDIVVCASDKFTGNNIWIVIRKLCLGALVYFIWQERNKRIFLRKRRTVDVLRSAVIDSVRGKLQSLKVRMNAQVKHAFTIWNVKIVEEI